MFTTKLLSNAEKHRKNIDHRYVFVNHIVKHRSKERLQWVYIDQLHKVRNGHYTMILIFLLSTEEMEYLQIFLSPFY